MSINKFNRKFKRILASSLLGALCYSQNAIVNATATALINLKEADRLEMYNRNISALSFSNDKVIRNVDGSQKSYSHKKLTKKIYSKDFETEFVAVEYKDETMPQSENVIFVKNRLNRVIILPYDDDIIELLPKYFDKLGDDYVLPKNEGKWWNDKQECIDHLKALDLDSKTNKTDKNNDTFIDDIARYLGLSRWQTIGLILGGGIVIIGGTVWILKSLLSSVGKAGSDIIHGSNDKNSEKQFVQIPIASSLAPAPAPIIINNK